MSEHDRPSSARPQQPAPPPDAEPADRPRFSDPADETGRSRLWLPMLAAMFLFLLGVAAIMLIATLVRDAEAPVAPGADVDPPAAVDPTGP